jgi:uncharacterized membrane protein SirB2
MSLLLLKILHISCAAISYTLFFLRGIWRLNDAKLLQQRWVKITPHLIDTVLLGSAVALVYRIGQYPFIDAWLSAKVIALLFYIGLGSYALKYAKSKKRCLIAWLTAQVVFGYIVLVAINHHPTPLIN